MEKNSSFLETIEKQYSDSKDIAMRKESLQTEEKEFYESVQKYNRLIEWCGVFPIKELSDMLIKLLEIYENKAFIYQAEPLVPRNMTVEEEKETYEAMVKYMEAQQYNTFDLNLRLDRKHHKGILIEQMRARTYYGVNEYDLLCSTGEIIILPIEENRCYPYKMSLNDYLLKQNFQQGKYSYVKEYIDYCVDYAISHEKKLALESMEECFMQFLKNKKEEIEERVKKQNSERTKALSDAFNRYGIK